MLLESVTTSRISTAVSQAQVLAAVNAEFDYFWRLDLDDGRTVDQFDDSGAERRVGEYCHIMEKSHDDPYPGSFVLLGVTRAAWMPTNPALAKGICVERGDGEGIVLYRKWYRRPGTKYCVYVIGSRFVERVSHPKEVVFHVCPSAMYDPKTDVLATRIPVPVPGFIEFPGGISRTSCKDTEHDNPFDLFMKSCDPANCV